MTYEELQSKKNSYGNRFWELKLDGTDKTVDEIEAILVAEGCPTDDEVESAYIAETGMSFDVAAEMEHVKRCVIAEARYWDKH